MLMIMLGSLRVSRSALPRHEDHDTGFAYYGNGMIIGSCCSTAVESGGMR